MNGDRPRTPIPDSTPFVDIAFDPAARPQGRRLARTIVVLLLVGALLAYLMQLSPLINAWFRSLPSWGWGVAIWCSVMIAVWSKVLVRLFLCRRHAQRLDSNDVGSFIRHMLMWLPPQRSSLGALIAMQRLAREASFAGLIRVARPDDLRPIAPIEHAFEPISPSELNSSMSDLYVHAGAAPDLSETASAGQSADSNHPVPRLTGLGRFVHRLGGGIAARVFILGLVIGCGFTWLEGRISALLVFFGLMTLWQLFAPAVFALRYRAQPFVVPAGIVIRKRRWGGGGEQVELFDRRSAILCVVRGFGGAWIAAVGDRRAQYQWRCTPREADFLPRAWLSPLEPPDPAKLSDLA